MEQIIASPDPYPVEAGARRRDRAVVDRLPSGQTGVGLNQHQFVEQKIDRRNAKGSDKKRREYLVCRNARRLENHHLAILVQRREGDERCQKDRKRQELRNNLRGPQRDVAPDIAFIIAADRQNLAGFRQQIEALQDDNQRRQKGQRPHQEHFCGILGDGFRRERPRQGCHVRYPADRALSRQPPGRTNRPTAFDIRENIRSSPPIGCPPGLNART